MSRATDALGALTRAYEALRAQATGALPTSAPRGLALFLARGAPAWLAAWTPHAPQVPAPAPRARPLPVPVAGDALVQVLTAMALGRRTRGAA